MSWKFMEAEGNNVKISETVETCIDILVNEKMSLNEYTNDIILKVIICN